MKYALFYICAVLLMSYATPVDAQFSSDVQLSGYAWSSTIGWISFSGTATDGSSYGVVIEPDADDDGVSDITGYAWSTIGWIQFGGLGTGAMPSGNGTTNVNAQIDLDTNEVTGWVRACAATTNANCTGGTDVNSGGWDGWISLSGTASNGAAYGVTNTASAFNGFAWGSDVVGWVSFSGSNYGVTMTPPCSPGTQCNGNTVETLDQWCRVVATATCADGEACSGGACVPNTVIGTLNVSPQAARRGGTVEIDWNAPTAAECDVEQVSGGTTTLSADAISGGPLTSDPITGFTTIRLMCNAVAGTTKSLSAEVEVRILPGSFET